MNLSRPRGLLLALTAGLGLGACANVGALRTSKAGPDDGVTYDVSLRAGESLPEREQFSSRSWIDLSAYVDLGREGAARWDDPDLTGLAEAFRQSGHFAQVDPSQGATAGVDAVVEIWTAEVWYAPAISVLSTLASFVTLTFFPGVRSDDLVHAVRVRTPSGEPLGDFVVIADVDYVLWVPMLLFNVFGESEMGTFGHFREQALADMQHQVAVGVARLLADPQTSDSTPSRDVPAPTPRDDAPGRVDDDRWETDRPPR